MQVTRRVTLNAAFGATVAAAAAPLSLYPGAVSAEGTKSGILNYIYTDEIDKYSITLPSGMVSHVY
jgi:hypothetical protein